VSDPKSLVEVLSSRAENYARSYRELRGNDRLRAEGALRECEAIESLAAPYAARLAALERVFEAAKDLYENDGSNNWWMALRDALAAVPEIPEKTDE
jgi:hypothetical protein